MSFLLTAKSTVRIYNMYQSSLSFAGDISCTVCFSKLVYQQHCKVWISSKLISLPSNYKPSSQPQLLVSIPPSHLNQISVLQIREKIK